VSSSLAPNTYAGQTELVAGYAPAPQTITNAMPGVSIFTTYSVTYSKSLQSGDQVEGSVQLTGQYYNIDNSYEWTFQVIGLGGEFIHEWTGNWASNNYHEFSVTASYAGTYKLKVSHGIMYSKDLTIQIWPPGWQ
jgi:hypothetical protein